MELSATRALKEIQSEKAKGAVVLSPVHANVVPLHEPRVDIKEKATGGTSLRIRSCPIPRGVSYTDEAVEIGDRRWLVALGDGSGQDDMKDFRPWSEGLDTAGDGVRQSAGGTRQPRPPQVRAEHEAKCAGRRHEELAPL